MGKPSCHRQESVLCRCAPREVKHLSTWRNRKQKRGLLSDQIRVHHMECDVRLNSLMVEKLNSKLALRATGSQSELTI